MNTNEFVNALVRYPMHETFVEVLRTLQTKQRGSLPEEEQIHAFYQSCTDDEKQHVKTLVRYCVASSFFRLLVVLDNCDAIVDCDEKPELELYAVHGDERERLGGPPDLLHDNLPPFEELIRDAY